jgi:hypothetical protein
VCAIGRPICQVSSIAISPARATIQSTMRPQISIRRSSGVCRHSCCARTALSSVASISASVATRTSAATEPSMGEIVFWSMAQLHNVKSKQ